jgi:hypothetical protein
MTGEDERLRPQIGRREFILALILFFGGSFGLAHYQRRPDNESQSKTPPTGYGEQGYGKGGYGGIVSRTEKPTR